MSRKDYIEAARILRETPLEPQTRRRLVDRFVTMFADDNPAFSPSRFREACQPPPASSLDDVLDLLDADGEWDTDDDQLVCRHGHIVEQDGECPEGCVSPLLEHGLV